MLRTIQLTRTNNLTYRLAAIAVFTLLMVISSKISIEIGAVPITMQVFVVLLSGMVLGSRDGALSQVGYLALITANLPVDARGLGAAALFGPTGGYIMGFAIAAFVIGWMVENSQNKVWQRFLAGIVGILIIYAIGTPFLKYFFDIFRDGASWQQAWQWGVAPFIVLDLIKALIAATIVEGTRSLLLMRSESVKEQ